MKYKNKIFKTKKEYKITKNVTLPVNTEIQVVNDVIYMGGHPVSIELQDILLKWLINNESELIDESKYY